MPVAIRMSQFFKKVAFTTDLNADSVEWCPATNYRHLFICGTYQLSAEENNKDENERNPEELRQGHLYLFQLIKGPEVIRQLDKISMVGILDCKWAHRELNDRIYLAVATAIGEVCIYRLKDERSITLELVYTHKLCSNPTLIALSLDWSTGVNSSDVKLVISDSEGFITLCSFEGGQLTEDCKYKLHNYQAWIVAFNYWDTNVFYSGGDDNKLYTYDRRANKVNRNDKAHTAGITSMHFNPKKEHTLVSGSYDEKILFWDVRNMDHPQTAVDAGGGVWRLKWEPRDCEDIAAACMHNGFAVVDGTQKSVVAEYKEHTSLAYGIDWSHLEQSELFNYFENINYAADRKYHALAMCSFYDNTLSVALFHKAS